MKTLNNFSLDNTFDEITIGQVTICAPSTAVYKLTLPIDTGTPGQVLTTDGGGLTSWSTSTVGSVTSVAATVPLFLNISGSPITTSGTLAIGLSGTALPVTSGGTGVLLKTGDTSVVLSNAPTINSLTTTGTNKLGGVVGLEDTPLYLRTVDTAHGLRWLFADGNNGPELFGFARGRLSIGGTPQEILSWDSVGIDVTGDISATGDISTESLIINGTFDTTLTTQATTNWTLSLPVDDGDNGQVLTTNGGGLTSWSTSTIGSVTSVAATVPLFLNISGSPITTSGTLAIGLSGTALPVASGGTGVLTKTGDTSVVLSNAPTINALNLTGDTDASGDIYLNAVLYLKAATDQFHGIQYSNAGGNDGPDIFGFGRGQLSIQGVKSLSWDSSGVDVVEALSAKSLTLTTDLAIAHGGTGSSTATGSGSVVLATSPTIASLTTTGTNIFAGTVSVNDVPLYLRSLDTTHGLKYSNAGGNNGPDLFGFGRGQLSTGFPTPLKSLSWDSSGVDVVEALSAKSMTLTTDLAVVHGGTGVGLSTGTTRVVLSDNPVILSPTLTTPIIKGASFDTVLTTQATEDWTLSLPVNDGNNGQVLTTNGGGLTSWSTSTVGSVTSVGISPPTFLNASAPITSSGDITLSYNGVALPVTSGGTGVLTKTGTTNVVLSNGPTIDALTLTGTTNVNSLLAMNDNEIRLRGSGDAAHGLVYNGTSDGPNLHGTSGGRLSQGGGMGTVRLTWNAAGVDVPDILSAGSLTLTTDLAIAHGGTGSSTATGSGSVVLATSPTIASLTTTGTTLMAGLNLTGNLGMQQNEIRLYEDTNPDHGLVYDGVAINGPNLHGFQGGRLSQGSNDGTARLTWDSTGTYTRGTGGANTYIAQYQTDLTGSLDSSIAVTAGESDEAAVFFGTVNINNPTNAHKVAIIADGQNDWNKANLHFCLDNNNDASTQASTANSRMMILSGGNVGIGNTNPSVKLDVTGAIKASGAITGGSMTLTGEIQMNGNAIRLDSTNNSGIVHNGTDDGPDVFAQGRGRLSSGGTPRLYWNSSGISTNGTDSFRYENYSFTPVWGGDGTPVYNGAQTGFVSRIGRSVTVTVQIDVSVSGATNGSDVFFTGLGVTNPLSQWQRVTISSASLSVLSGAPHFVIKNGSSNLNLYAEDQMQIVVDGFGNWSGNVFTSFCFIGADF